MKRTWTAFIAVIVMAFVNQLLVRFVPSQFDTVLTAVWMVMMVFLGYILAPHAKQNNRWLGKVLLSILVVLIFGYQLGILNVASFQNALNTIGLSGRFLDILLITCGWAFFQV